MSHDTEDEHTEDAPTIGEPRSAVPEPESIADIDLLLAESTSDHELDDIRLPRSRKRPMLLTRTYLSSDAEDDTFDLIYPEDSDVVVSL
jgi:hypothetical protein